MTAINHAITGAVIGFVVGAPLLALPIAFVSHFVCDAMPHFDPSMPAEQWICTKAFTRLLIVDALLCLLLIAVLAVMHPYNWLLAAMCAFVAASPDLYWIRRFTLTRRGLVWTANWFERFAIAIQWFTAPIGAVVELVWFSTFAVLILPFLRNVS